MNAKYTNAEPVSFCIMISSIGSKMIVDTAIRCFLFFMLKLYMLMNRAKASAVANLANSAGWRLTGPKINHEREPFVSGAMNMVMMSKAINAV